MCANCKDDPSRAKHWVLLSVGFPNAYGMVKVTGWNYEKNEPIAWLVDAAMENPEWDKSVIDWGKACNAFMENAGRINMPLEKAIAEEKRLFPVPPVVVAAQRLATAARAAS